MRLFASGAQEMNFEELSLETIEEVFKYTIYLGIDPGESNGISLYDKDYNLVGMFTIKEEQIIEFLEPFKSLKLIVCEDFVLYPTKAMKQVYSDMPTSRVIGRIESFCRGNNVLLIKQLATIKTTGYKWIGKKPLPKSNPRNHEMDAHVHFMYWAIKNGKIDAASLL